MNDKLLAEWFWTDRWTGSSAFALPIDARGLYREMLTQSWRRHAQLPNDHDQIRRLTGVTLKEWRHAWPLVERYWIVKGDALVNETQVEVYEEAQRRMSVNGRRAQAGAQARWKHSPSNAQASTQAKPEQCPPISVSDLRSPKEQKISARRTAPHPDASAGDERFARFWANYPNKKGKAAARKAWDKLHPSEALTGMMLVALEQQRFWPEWMKDGGQYVPHPATWLNAGRWDDEPIGAEKSLLSDVDRRNLANAQVALELMEAHDAGK